MDGGLHVYLQPFLHAFISSENIKITGDAGIWTRGLLHAKQALYRWATPPIMKEWI